jgi:hypothetical protein
VRNIPAQLFCLALFSSHLWTATLVLLSFITALLRYRPWYHSLFCPQCHCFDYPAIASCPSPPLNRFRGDVANPASRGRGQAGRNWALLLRQADCYLVERPWQQQPQYRQLQSSATVHDEANLNPIRRPAGRSLLGREIPFPPALTARIHTTATHRATVPLKKNCRMQTMRLRTSRKQIEEAQAKTVHRGPNPAGAPQAITTGPITVAIHQTCQQPLQIAEGPLRS